MPSGKNFCGRIACWHEGKTRGKWIRNLEALRAEQEKAQGALDTAMAEGQKLAEASERIPQELKDRVTTARDEVVRLGEEYTTAEAAQVQATEEDASFLRSMAGPVAETIKRAGTVVKPNGQSEPQYALSRDTIMVLHEMAREKYGSSLELPYPINPESERLMRDMLGCEDMTWAARAPDFAVRAKKLRQEQQRVTDPVTAGGTGQGGNLVPDDNTFMREVQKAKLAYGGIAQVSRVITTPSGAPLPIPTINDTAATGAGSLAESGTASDVDLNFGNHVLNAHMTTSGRLGATVQAIQDAGPNLPMLIGMLAAERIERTEAARFATGTGTNQPTGALVAFTQHVTPDLQYDISDATLVNAWQSFIRVKYAVNAGWRQSPNFSFIPGDTLDMLFAAAVDDDARPIFPQWGFGSTAKGMGMNLGGMNIRADYNIAAIVLTTALANSNAGLVGDFSQFWIRRVAGMHMIRDPYTQANDFEVNWVFGRRCDSDGVLNATSSTNPSVRVARLDVVA